MGCDTFKFFKSLDLKQKCVPLSAFGHQVDVLESQFSQLLQQINATRDFESIRLAHDHFLSNLLAQSFILLKPVRIAKLVQPGVPLPHSHPQT